MTWVSYLKSRLMHILVITTLLILRHCDMFHPSKGHLRGVWQTLSNSKANNYHTLLIKLNFTSGNSFCWPCCWNVSVVAPEDGSLRAETCRSGIVLIINVCISRFFMWNSDIGARRCKDVDMSVSDSCRSCVSSNWTWRCIHGGMTLCWTLCEGDYALCGRREIVWHLMIWLHVRVRGVRWIIWPCYICGWMWILKHECLDSDGQVVFKVSAQVIYSGGGRGEGWHNVKRVRHSLFTTRGSILVSPEHKL